MTRYVPVLLLCLLWPGAASAQTTMEWLTLGVIDWGDGMMSRGDIRASGLPSIQSARESARRNSTARRTYEPIRIRKRIDKASPLLQQAHRTRRPLPRIVLKGRNSAGKPQSYLLWELKQARITSYSVSGSGASAMEQVTLVFQEIRRIR